MMITFEDGAFDSYVSLVNKIPPGYTVALLGDNEQPSDGGEIELGTDVRFISADHFGVSYQLIDRRGVVEGDEVVVRSWEHVARVHVY